MDRLPASDRPIPRFSGSSIPQLQPEDGESSGARSGSGIGPDAISLPVADILAALKRLDPSRYSFTADVGDSWFIALELRTEVFLAAGYYASMGFAVPGALGAGCVCSKKTMASSTTEGINAGGSFASAW